MFFTLVILKLNIERETLLVQVLKLLASHGDTWEQAVIELKFSWRV